MKKYTDRTIFYFRLSLLFLVVGIIFGVAETIYFGSNWLPQSRAEFVCDFISIALTQTGTTLFGVAFIEYINNIYNNS